MRYLWPLLVLATLAVACQDRPRPGSQPLPEPVTSPAGAAGGAAGQKPSTAPPTAPTPAAPTGPRTETVWEHLGEWSGRQSVQTESFTGVTGAFRIKWEAKGPADGKFLLTIHSSISGRPLMVAVDQKGPGGDVAYVNEDPRVFFAVIDSDRMEWRFSVEEAMGTRTFK